MAKRLKWGNVEDLRDKINEYFENKKIIGEPPTIAGLCLHLGVSREFWNYYTTNRWRVHRKSEEQTEEINKNVAESLDNEGFEEYTSINQYMEVIDNEDKLKDWETAENYTIKAQMSDTLKIAALKFEDYTVQQMFTAKNPAGSIFYAKAALGYRETDSDSSNNNGSMPSKITIQIMPAPNQPQLDSSNISIKMNDL